MKFKPLFLLPYLFLFILACGGDDEMMDMGPDMTARIVGSYDGTYFETVGGSFGPNYNGRALTAVTQLDNNTIRIANGVSPDAVFTATLTSETEFIGTDISIPNFFVEDLRIEGTLTLGSTPAQDSISYVATSAANPALRMTFRGTRR